MKNSVKKPTVYRKLFNIFSNDYKKVLKKAGPFLPIGLYLVDDQGYFRYCSEACRQILGISLNEDVTKIKIDDFYVNPEERQQLINKLNESKGKLINQIINFRRKDTNTKIFVEDNCQRHETCSVPGEYCLVGSISEVTDIVRYRQLFDHLSAGVFRVNSNNILIMANQAVAKILGYDSTNEILNLSVSHFWKTKSEFEKYDNFLHKKGELNNYITEMVKRDGQSLFISINSKLWKNGDGQIIGSEGTFSDVTKERKYVDAFERFSTGYYEIRYVKNKHRIFDCNKMFAKMHGYESRDEVIGLDIATFHYDKEKRDAFFREFEKSKQNNRTIFEKFKLQSTKKDGTPFWVQLDIGLIRDSSGEVIGRDGIVVDIDDQVTLENKLAEKERELNKTFEDMDKFVHQYISPIMNIDSTAQTLMEFLEKRLAKNFEDVKNIDIGDGYLPALLSIIDEFFEMLDEEDLQNRDVNRLKGLTQNLTSVEKQYPDLILRDLATREIIFGMSDVISCLIKKYKSDMESSQYLCLMKIKGNIFVILDFFILKLQNRILNNTRKTYKVIESLRNYLFSGREQQFDFSKVNIIKVLNENIEMYYSMAKQKGLSIIPPKQDYIPMNISEAHIDRMFSNILLNAIKYSYKRSGGYINIRMQERKHNLEIQFVNYGVPVEEDELQKVFEFGYRGKYSFDWNRTGSGVGLADAKITMDKHGGEIYLTSKPVVQSESKKTKERIAPNITTVTIVLPKRREI